MLQRMADGYRDDWPKQPPLVRIAEYGCSGGRNSYAPMHTMISALRGRHPALRVECVLEYLPSNTWHQVMAEAPRLSAAFAGGVQVLCAGTSFYSQVCADASLDLSTEVQGESDLPASVLAPLVRRRVEAVWGGMFLTQLGRLGRSAASSREVMGEVWDLFEDGIEEDTARGWLDMRAFYLQLTRK
jgi:hypothetical protein